MDGYGSDFAAFYDLVLYGENSHEADEREISFMEKEFLRSNRRISTVLDAGCGTGKFLVPLARKGYQMTGIDKSPRMIKETSKKLTHNSLSASLTAMDIGEIKANQVFDAVICVDSVLCYLLEKQKIQECCAKMVRGLKKGGIFIMETWNLFANSGLLNRENSYLNEDGERKAEIFEKNTYDEKTGILTISLDVNARDKGVSYVLKHSESLRIFKFEVMKEILENAGLKDIKMYSGYDFSQPSLTKGDSMIYSGMNK